MHGRVDQMAGKAVHSRQKPANPKPCPSPELPHEQRLGNSSRTTLYPHEMNIQRIGGEDRLPGPLLLDLGEYDLRGSLLE